MKKVAIVILNWNGKLFLQQFLPSVVKYSDFPGVEIVVADNGSTDDSLDFLTIYFPFVKIVKLSENYGFAGGYNKALSQIQAEYFVLLNSDVEVSEGWLMPIIAKLDADKTIAAAMPKVLFTEKRNRFEYAGAAGGFIDKFGYPFCRGRVLYTCEIDEGQYDTPIEVFWATGACLFIRAELFHLMNGFDELFFAHMEEIDLCWRLKNHGYRIMCYPQSVIFHAGGGTLSYDDPRKLYLNFRNNLLAIYKNIHYSRLIVVFVVRVFLDALAAFRFLFSGRMINAISIIRAYISLILKLPKYSAYRYRLPQLKKHSGVFNGTIVFQYWFFKRKYFSMLNQNFIKKEIF